MTDETDKPEDRSTARILKGKFKWHGPDRRRSEDRRDDDRRAEVRYEPDKEDRREPLDRRVDKRTADGYRKAKHPDRDGED